VNDLAVVAFRAKKKPKELLELQQEY